MQFKSMNETAIIIWIAYSLGGEFRQAKLRRTDYWYW